MKQIDKLIINTPYQEPEYYWHYDREHRRFEKREGRRPAGYVVATPGSKSFDDPGIFVPIELVEKIRPRVKAWREKDYPGVTGITRRLLHHWQGPEERKDRRFFFCQLEAIQTLIWLTEAPEADMVTGKPCEYTEKSIINHVVVDSTWEASEAFQLDKSENVDAWVKNDHLGFAILYNYRGVVRKYYPDFIIRLKNGDFLILETKGQDTDIDRTKRFYLQEWIKAVTNHGGFGIWREAISFDPNDLSGILREK